MSNPTQLRLNDVRLAFPSLFRKAIFQEKETKYEGHISYSKRPQGIHRKAQE